MWLLSIGLYILIPMEHSALRLVYHGIHLITFAVFALLVFTSLRQSKLDGFNIRRFTIILAMIFVICLSLLSKGKSFSISVHIMGILSFLEMLLAIFIVDQVPQRDSTMKFVFGVNLIIAIVFIFLSRTDYAYSDKIIGSLSLGYSNPNATAIYLLLNFSLLLLYPIHIRNPISRITVYTICSYLLYLIYETDSRTCLIAALMVAVYILFAPKWRIPKILLPIIMLIPLAFLFFYAYLYRTGQYQDLEILGKPFYSGREGYFVQMLEELKSNWLVGDVVSYPFSNMHNGPLTLLSGCGVIGYLLYLQFTGSTIRHYYHGTVSRTQTVALVVIFATFINSCSEAALVTGGANYAIVLSTFYWLLKGNITERSGL
jgi:hypothetical protein